MAFTDCLTILCKTYPSAAQQIALELEASRKDSGLLYFGPEWVIISSFLQLLLWTSAWLQDIAAQQQEAGSGKRGKESKSTAKLSNGKAAADEKGLDGKVPASIQPAVSSLQKAITDSAKIIQVHCLLSWT